MFKIEKNDKQLSFSSEKENSLFGDGSRILFWIDLETGGLQRGRQEFIPLDTISRFTLSEEGQTLCCDLSGAEMKLYKGVEGEEDFLAEAVAILNNYCGIN